MIAAKRTAALDDRIAELARAQSLLADAISLIHGTARSSSGLGGSMADAAVAAVRSQQCLEIAIRQLRERAEIFKAREAKP